MRRPCGTVSFTWNYLFGGREGGERGKERERGNRERESEEGEREGGEEDGERERVGERGRGWAYEAISDLASCAHCTEKMHLAHKITTCMGYSMYTSVLPHVCRLERGVFARTLSLFPKRSASLRCNVYRVTSYIFLDGHHGKLLGKWPVHGQLLF